MRTTPEHPEQQDALIVTDAVLQRPRCPWGKGFLALCGTLVWPGVGHLLVGAWRMGFAWILGYFLIAILALAALASERWLIVGVLLAILSGVFFLVVLVHAFIAGRRSRYRLGPVWARYLGGCALVALALVLQPGSRVSRFFRERWVDTFVQSGHAMAPTLQPGDYFLLNRRLHPLRWSLVILEHPDYGPGVPVVSRLVGLPGERVEIVDGEVTIDGLLVQRPPGVSARTEIPYAGMVNPVLSDKRCAGCQGHPILLGADEYYVLGDNTDIAKDSRLWETPVEGHQLGALPADWLRSGRVTAIYWPPSRWRQFAP